MNMNIFYYFERYPAVGLAYEGISSVLLIWGFFSFYNFFLVKNSYNYSKNSRAASGAA